MTWIRLNVSTLTDPRIEELADILDVGVYSAAGIFALLLCWTSEHAQDGDLSKFSPRVIARKIGWTGDAPALLNALEAAGITARGILLDAEDSYGELQNRRAANASRMRDARAKRAATVDGARATHVRNTCNARAQNVQGYVTVRNATDETDGRTDVDVDAHAPTPAREVPAENPTTATTTPVPPPSVPIGPETPERHPEAFQPLPPPSARQDQETPPRSAPPPPPAGPPPGHLRQPPRGPAWHAEAPTREDCAALRAASLQRLVDPGLWLVSVTGYIRDKGDPPALQRWEGLTQADRIAEAVAALEITGQQVRGAWDAYAKKLLLEAMAGGRSLAQERAAPARASPAQEAENLSPGQNFRRYIEKIGHPAAFGAGPPPAPDEGPIIDVEAG